MVEPSQLFNRVLGRNTDTGGVEFWRQPERSGWLMKQGKRDPDGPGPAAFDCRRPNPFLIASIVGEFVKTWRRRCGTLSQERRAGVAAQAGWYAWSKPLLLLLNLPGLEYNAGGSF